MLGTEQENSRSGTVVLTLPHLQILLRRLHELLAVPPDRALGQRAQVVVKREARGSQDARPYLVPVAPPAPVIKTKHIITDYDFFTANIAIDVG